MSGSVHIRRSSVRCRATLSHVKQSPGKLCQAASPSCSSAPRKSSWVRSGLRLRMHATDSLTQVGEHQDGKIKDPSLSETFAFAPIAQITLSTLCPSIIVCTMYSSRTCILTSPFYLFGLAETSPLRVSSNTPFVSLVP